MLRILYEGIVKADSTAATAEDVLSEVLQELVAERICRRKAEELGVTELTAEDEDYIIKFFDACGYDIIFSFVSKVRKKVADTEVSIILHDNDKYESKYANRRLGFFQKAMDSNGVSSAAFSEYLSIDKTTIFYWFKQDDCAISYLYRFAEYAKLKLKIEIRPKA